MPGVGAATEPGIAPAATMLIVDDGRGPSSKRGEALKGGIFDRLNQERPPPNTSTHEDGI